MDYTGFLFLDKRGKPMMPYQWKSNFQHVVKKYNQIYQSATSKDNTTCVPSYICTPRYSQTGISVETLKYLMDIQI